MADLIPDHRLAEGTRRLLVAPDDLIAGGARRLAGSAVEQAGTPAHRALHAEYLAALRPVVAEAAEWWRRSMAYQADQTGSEEAARATLIQMHPAGPASDMHVIGVVRTYWLACDGINRGVAPEEWLDPPKFLLAWTIAAGEALAVEVLASQPYWPIGLTAEGEWC